MVSKVFFMCYLFKGIFNRLHLNTVNPKTFGLSFSIFKLHRFLKHTYKKTVLAVFREIEINHL